MKWFCKNHTWLLLQTDEDGRTVLHHAATYGHLDVVQWFCKNHAWLLLQTDNDGQTVLHYVATRGYLELVKWFCEEHPELLFKTDNDEQTALHLATELQSAIDWRHRDIVKYLRAKTVERLALERDKSPAPVQDVVPVDSGSYQFFFGWVPADKSSQTSSPKLTI